MHTRSQIDCRAAVHGRANTTLIAVIVLVILLGLGAWLLIIRPYQASLVADTPGQPAQSTSAAKATTAAPPANVAAMGVDELLDEGRKALNDRRYLEPAGNNAFEFYLHALETQPGNRVATDALRETFPLAATSAEQAINARAFEDAQRQIDLLAKADPTNYTLTILRSKLDAQRKMLDQQQQDELDRQKAQLAATQQAALDKQATDRLLEQQAQQAAAQPAPAAPPAAAPVPAPVAAATSATANPGAASRANSDAVLTRAVTPNYPPVALRSRQSGWVVVSFTVGVDGSTTDIAVVDSQPRRVFDNAATDAVRRYQFTPAMRNGVAVASRREQRIEFNL